MCVQALGIYYFNASLPLNSTYLSGLFPCTLNTVGKDPDYVHSI